MTNYYFAKLANGATLKAFDQGDDIQIITNNNGVTFQRWFSIHRLSRNETFDQAADRCLSVAAQFQKSHITLKFKGSE
ncbi:MAG: hypothetical protein P8I94_01890 [Emcibacteraceae bacterium]|nr:hypothetical protein [Emcibacteraceae bacterium]